MRRTSIARPALAVVAVSLAAGCGGGPTKPAPPGLVKVASGLDEPIDVVQPPGGGPLYVAERPGLVVVVRNGTVGQRPFLDIRSRVREVEEAGMLSIAFAPDYERTGRFYIAYSGKDHELHLDELRAQSPTKVDPSSRRPLLAIAHPNDIHWGGQLQFAADGDLYISTGDGGPLLPIPTTAQDTYSLLGKLLRIDPRPSGGAPYSIPNGNPFADGVGGAPEVYSYGLRNPWRFSFDSKTGAIAIGDVGADREEEVDYTKLARARGANFGWPAYEGDIRLDTSISAPGSIRPAVAYAHRTKGPDGLDPPCAVIGGYVVRDPDLPVLDGRYLYADFCTADLRSFVATARGVRDDRSTGLVLERITAFGEDDAGHLYAVSLNGKLVELAPGGKKRL